MEFSESPFSRFIDSRFETGVSGSSKDKKAAKKISAENMLSMIAETNLRAVVRERFGVSVNIGNDSVTWNVKDLIDSYNNSIIIIV